MKAIGELVGSGSLRAQQQMAVGNRYEPTPKCALDMFSGLWAIFGNKVENQYKSGVQIKIQYPDGSIHEKDFGVYSFQQAIARKLNKCAGRIGDKDVYYYDLINRACDLIRADKHIFVPNAGIIDEYLDKAAKSYAVKAITKEHTIMPKISFNNEPVKFLKRSDRADLYLAIFAKMIAGRFVSHYAKLSAREVLTTEQKVDVWLYVKNGIDAYAEGKNPNYYIQNGMVDLSLVLSV